ncbi:hypothetical protein ACFY8F_11375 [Streptomyces tanashiensis]|uniref:hypothetical protein n=1 Tax=Streptomyces tanashiensis TaxID=67367 RepID=UPI0036B69DC8
MRGRTTARHRSRSRGALLALALLCAAAAPLAGCSSGGDGNPTPDSDVSTDATATDGTTGQPDQDEDEQERRKQEQDDGSFSRAGRLSDGFSGHWPQSYKKTVTNPSSDPYVGTLWVLDCTPGEENRPAIPPSRTVNLSPGGEDAPEFTFSQEGGNTKATRQVCAILRNEGGVSDEVSEPISADIVPPPGETTGDTTEGTTGDTTEGTTGETSEGTTGDTTGDTTEGTTGDTTGDTTEGTTGETSEGTTGDTTGDTAGGSSAGPGRSR